MKTIVANIQKFCVDDGPGIRTIVFLKGCPLRCKWCQNPEDLEPYKQLMYNNELCVSCGACVDACPYQVNKPFMIDDELKIVFEREKCRGCGECVHVCRYDARDLAGKEMTVEEVFEEFMKDEVFYRNTGGGLTLSGGECTLHPKFSTTLLKMVQAQGIHTTIETCGYCDESTMKQFAECVDLFLFDFKILTPSLHRYWTGKGNTRILRNLEMLLKMKKELIIRIPLIPEVNTGKELVAMMKYLTTLEGIRKVHILPFHQIGASKYTLSGREYLLEDKPACTNEEVEEARRIVESFGFSVNVGGWDS